VSTAMYAFDTLAFAKKLKSAGYTEAQAEALVEAHSQVFREMLESTLATKDDVRDMATKADIASLDHKIDLVASKMTVRLGGMIVAGVAVLAAIHFFG